MVPSSGQGAYKGHLRNKHGNVRCGPGSTVAPMAASQDPPHISVVIPAYNEVDILAETLAVVIGGLRGAGQHFEVLVVENGATDGTLELAQQAVGQYPELQVLHQDAADYGRALRAGLMQSAGDIVVNFDCDYYDLEFLDAAVTQLVADPGLSLVIGSKRAAGANDQRTFFRRCGTTIYTGLLRYGFGLTVSDTHGVKAMRRADVVPLAIACISGQDMFDSELILRAERAGLVLAEIPVDIVELRPARSSYLSRVPRTLRGLLQLRIALAREARHQSSPSSR